MWSLSSIGDFCDTFVIVAFHLLQVQDISTAPLLRFLKIFLSPKFNTNFHGDAGKSMKKIMEKCGVTDIHLGQSNLK